VKLRPDQFPKVIADLVAAYVEASKGRGVHGRVTVHEERAGNSTLYVIEVRVPAGETVAARAWKAPKR
jgi:hypothetical protein